MDSDQPYRFVADEDLINRAIGIVGQRYGCDVQGASMLLMDWSRAAGVTAIDVAHWLTIDDRTDDPDRFC